MELHNDNAKKITNSYLNPLNAETDSVIVYGPQGCGKTKNSLAIAAALGLRNIRDEWNVGKALAPKNTLHLTSRDVSKMSALGCTIMSFDEAMNIVRPRR